MIVRTKLWGPKNSCKEDNAKKRTVDGPLDYIVDYNTNYSRDYWDYAGLRIVRYRRLTTEGPCDVVRALYG